MMFRTSAIPTHHQLVTQRRFNSSNNNNTNNNTSKLHPKFTATDVATQALKMKSFAERAKLIYLMSTIFLNLLVILLVGVVSYRLYKYWLKYNESRQAAVDIVNQQFERAAQLTNESMEVVKAKSSALIEQWKVHLPILKEKAEATLDMIQAQITPEMKEKAVEVKDQMMNKVTEFLEERKKKT